MSGTSRLTEEEYLALLEPMAQELSAMARWVSETGQRMIVILEGRDTAGKGGSIAANAASSRFRRRASASARNGISSAISSICPPPAKSCCSIAAGTTAPASSA
jgi:hypothetical protein